MCLCDLDPQQWPLWLLPPCLGSSAGALFRSSPQHSLWGGNRGHHGVFHPSLSLSLPQAGDDAFAVPDLLGAFHPLRDGDRAGLQVSLPLPPSPGPGFRGEEGGGRRFLGRGVGCAGPCSFWDQPRFLSSSDSSDERDLPPPKKEEPPPKSERSDMSFAKEDRCFLRIGLLCCTNHATEGCVRLSRSCIPLLALPLFALPLALSLCHDRPALPSFLPGFPKSTR